MPLFLAPGPVSGKDLKVRRSGLMSSRLLMARPSYAV